MLPGPNERVDRAAENDEAACGTCHPEATDAWSNSHHALAQRPIEVARDGGLHDGRLPDGQVASAAIGVHPLVQYLVKDTGGRQQAHSLAWHVDTEEWFLTHSEQREEGDWGHCFLRFPSKMLLKPLVF